MAPPSEESHLLDASIAEFHESQDSLDSRLNQALRTLETTFGELDDIVRMHSSQLQEYQTMVDLLRDLEKSDADKEKICFYKGKLYELKEKLDRMKSSKPRTGSVFLRYTLGHVNMKVWKRSDIFSMKDEYNKFKKTSTYALIFFCATYLLACVYAVPALRLVRILQQLFMLYYYVSLALRENILQVNGSNIQDWWIQHHYLSMVLAIFTLVLPDDSLSLDFYWYSNWVLLFQGLVMIVQNSYQSQRQYVRTTLGKAKSIDPSLTETIIEKPVNLQILIPLLVLVYVADLSLALWCISLAFQNDNPRIGFIGLIILSIFLGNSITTSSVLFSKHRKRQLKKKQ